MKTRHIAFLLALSGIVVVACSDQRFTTNVDVSLRVIASTPSGNSEGVPIDAVVQVLFNQEVKPETLTSSTVLLEDLTDIDAPQAVEALLDYAGGDETTGVAPTLTVTPVDEGGARIELGYSRLYRLTLTTGLERKGPPRGTLVANVTSVFRVIDPPPLYILSRVPGPDETQVTRDTTGEVTAACDQGSSIQNIVFSESIKEEQIDVNGDGQWDDNDRSATTASVLSVVDVDTGAFIDGSLSFQMDGDASAPCTENAACTLEFVPTSQSFCRWGYSQAIEVTVKGGLESRRAARIQNAQGETRIRGSLGEDKEFSEPDVHVDAAWSYRVEEPPDLNITSRHPGPGEIRVARTGSSNPYDFPTGGAVECPDGRSMVTIRLSDGIVQSQIDTNGDGLWDATDRAAGSVLNIEDDDLATGSFIDGTAEFFDPAELRGDATLAGDDLTLVFTPSSLPFCRWNYSQSIRVTLGADLQSDRATRIVNRASGSRIRGTLGKNRDFSDAAANAPANWVFRVEDPPTLAALNLVPADSTQGVPRSMPIGVIFTDGIQQAQIDTDGDGDWDVDDRTAGSILMVEDADAGTVIDGTVDFVVLSDLDGTDPDVSGDDLLLTFTPTGLPFARWNYSQAVKITLAGALASDRATSITNTIAQTRIRGTLGQDCDFGDACTATDTVWTFRAKDPPALFVDSRLPGPGENSVPRTSSSTPFDFPVAGTVECPDGRSLLSVSLSDGVVQSQIDTNGDGLWDGTDRAAGSLLTIEDGDLAPGSFIDGVVAFVDAAEIIGDASLAGVDKAIIFTPTSLPSCRWNYSQAVRVTLDGSLQSDRATRITNVSSEVRISGTLGDDKDFADAASSVAVTWTFRAEDPSDLSIVQTQPNNNGTQILRDTPIVITFSEGIDQASVNAGVMVEDMSSGASVDITTDVSISFNAADAGTTPDFVGADNIVTIDPVGLPFALWGHSQSIRLTLAANIESDRATRITNVSAQDRIAGTLGEDKDFGDASVSTPVVITFQATDPPPLALIDRSPSSLAASTESEGVRLDAAIDLLFSEGLDQATLLAGATVESCGFDATCAAPTAIALAVGDVVFNAVDAPPGSDLIGLDDQVTISPTRVIPANEGGPLWKYSEVIRVTLANTVASDRATDFQAVPQGNLVGGVQFTFRTLDPPPLVIVSRDPSDASVRNPRSSDVRIVFSESLDPASIAGNYSVTRLIEGGSPTISDSLATTNVADDTLELSVTAPDYKYSEDIQVTLTGGAAGLRSLRATTQGGFVPADSTWSFFIEDVAAYSVAATNAGGSISFDRGGNIEVIFDRAYRCADVTAGSFFLTRVDDGSAIAASVMLSDTCSGMANGIPDTKAVLNPINDAGCTIPGSGLCFDTDYILHLTSTICAAEKDSDVDAASDGCLPAPELTYNFATSAPPGLSVDGVTPAEGSIEAASVNPDGEFEIRFNQGLYIAGALNSINDDDEDNSTATCAGTLVPGTNPKDCVEPNICFIPQASASLDCDAAAGAVDVDTASIVFADANATVRVKPASSLALGTDYFLAISDDVTSEFGISLTAPFASAFTTRISTFLIAVSASSTDDPSTMTVTARFSKDAKARRLLNGGMYMTYDDIGRTVVVPATVEPGNFAGGACDVGGASACDEATCAACVSADCSGECATCDCALLTPSIATIIGCQDPPVTARGIDAVLTVGGSNTISSGSYSFMASDVGRLVVLSSSLCELPDGTACTNDGVFTVTSVAAGAATVTGPAVQNESGLTFEVRDGSSPLPFDTIYTVHITTNVQSADGVDNVTPSAAQDERLVSLVTGTDPRVADVTYANATVSASKLRGARDVPYNSTITMSFNEAMDPTSIVDGTSVTLTALSSTGQGDTDSGAETLSVEAFEFFLPEDVARTLTITRASSAALLGAYAITSVSADGRTVTVDNFPANEENVEFNLPRNELFAGTLVVAGDALSATYTGFGGPSAGTVISRLHPSTTYELRLLGRTRTSAANVFRDAEGNAIQGDVVVTFTTSPPFSARLHPMDQTAFKQLHNVFVQFSRAVNTATLSDTTMFVEQPPGSRMAALLANTVADPDGILITPVPTWDDKIANIRATVTRAGAQELRDERGNSLLMDPTCDLDEAGPVDGDCVRSSYTMEGTFPGAIAGTLRDANSLVLVGSVVGGRQTFVFEWDETGNNRDSLLPSTFNDSTVTAILDPGGLDQLLDLEFTDFRFDLVWATSAATTVRAFVRLDGDFAAPPACSTSPCTLQINLAQTRMANLYTLAAENDISFSYDLDDAEPTIACASVLVDGSATGDTSGSGPTGVSSTATITATFVENTELKRETLVDAHGRCSPTNVTLTPATPTQCELLGNTLVITPTRPLARAITEYTIDFGAGILDTAGNGLTAVDCFFSTADAPLTAVVTPNAGTQPVDTSVTLTFNGQVDPATVTVPVSPTDLTASYRLTYDPAACGLASPLSLPGCLTFDAGFTIATYDPAEDQGLIGSLVYDVLVDNATITDASGLRTLDPVAAATFDAADDAPEHICTVENPGPIVELHFNEGLAGGTVVLDDSLWVYRTDTGALLAPTVDLTTASRIQIDLSGLGLVSGDEYGVIVTDAVTDPGATPLSSMVHEFFVVP